jgi:hypothetical protein
MPLTSQAHIATIAARRVSALQLGSFGLAISAERVTTSFVVGATAVALVGALMSAELSPLGPKEFGIIALTCLWTALCFAMRGERLFRVMYQVLLLGVLFEFAIGLWLFVSNEGAFIVAGLFFAISGVLFLGALHCRWRNKRRESDPPRRIVFGVGDLLVGTIFLVVGLFGLHVLALLVHT